jgi:RNA recognition motif-containing protein
MEVIRMNIYVGNLSYEVTEENLKEAFEAFGEVNTVKIIKDNYTGRSKGFGFVEMPSKVEAQSAIEGLNRKDLKGRSLNVSEARPRSEGRRGGARSGGPRHGGGRRGGGRRF